MKPQHRAPGVLCLLFLFLALPVILPAQPTNLLANGDFSQGTNGWTCVKVVGTLFPKFNIRTGMYCLTSQAGNPFLEVDVPMVAIGYAEHPVTVPASGTVSNRSYTVQFNDDWTRTNWLFYNDLTGTGGVMGFATRPTDSARRYFRVRQP